MDSGSSIGNKIKIPIGKMDKNDRAVITCILYTEIPFENNCYNFKLPFKYVPECLFKNEINSFIETDLRDESSKIDSESSNEHSNCNRNWNIKTKIHKQKNRKKSKNDLTVSSNCTII